MGAVQATLANMVPGRGLAIRQHPRNTSRPRTAQREVGDEHSGRFIWRAAVLQAGALGCGRGAGHDKATATEEKSLRWGRSCLRRDGKTSLNTHGSRNTGQRCTS